MNKVNQEVINTRFFHSGDLGDCIYSLPVLKHYYKEHGIPVTYYLNTRPWTKAFTEDRIKAITGLIKAQEYIEKVINGDPEGVFVDLSTFRAGGMPFAVNIMNLHSNWVGIGDIPYEPWLKAKADPYSKGRVIVHRSPRYRNTTFDWAQVIDAVGDRALSVGFEAEHKALEDVTGKKIERIQLRDYQHLAELISGADFFIGNQSSPCAVAIGLGQKVIQETCLWIPDCIFPGSKTQYGINGDIVIGDKKITSPTGIKIGSCWTPPEGWIHVDKNGIVHKDLLISGLARKVGISEEAIISENTSRIMRDHPKFLGFSKGTPTRLLLTIRENGLESYNDFQ